MTGYNRKDTKFDIIQWKVRAGSALPTLVTSGKLSVSQSHGEEQICVRHFAISWTHYNPQG